MPQRRWCALAQPQCSMKESLPDIVLLLEVDRTVTASTASNESRSLQLLLVLHTLVGGAELRRTSWDRGTDPARCAIQPAAGRVHAHRSPACTRHGAGVSRRRGGSVPAARAMSRLSTAPRRATAIRREILETFSIKPCSGTRVTYKTQKTKPGRQYGRVQPGRLGVCARARTKATAAATT